MIAPTLISDDGDVSLTAFLSEHITPEYLYWLTDAAVNRYTEARFHEHTLDTAQRYIKAANAEKTTLLFRIMVESSHVGNLRVSMIDRNHRRACIAVIIGDRNFQRCGVGSIAIRLAARFCFEGLGLEKLTAGMYSINRASIRAFEKAGFVREAVLPGHHRYGGRRIDGVLMGMFDMRNR